MEADILRRFTCIPPVHSESGCHKNAGRCVRIMLIIKDMIGCNVANSNEGNDDCENGHSNLKIWIWV